MVLAFKKVENSKIVYLVEINLLMVEFWSNFANSFLHPEESSEP